MSTADEMTPAQIADINGRLDRLAEGLERCLALMRELRELIAERKARGQL